MKTCKKCGETKELSEFHSTPYRPCKECRRNESKERYAKCKDYFTEYLKKNKGAISVQKHQYYKANKEKTLIRIKQWRETNPDKVKATIKRFYEHHPDYEKINAKEDRQQLKNHYVRKLISRKVPLEYIPQSLIEAKRLEILIKRRVKNENSNNT